MRPPPPAIVRIWLEPSPFCVRTMWMTPKGKTFIQETSTTNTESAHRRSFVDGIEQLQKLTEKAEQALIEDNLYPTNCIEEL